MSNNNALCLEAHTFMLSVRLAYDMTGIMGSEQQSKQITFGEKEGRMLETWWSLES